MDLVSQGVARAFVVECGRVDLVSLIGRCDDDLNSGTVSLEDDLEGPRAAHKAGTLSAQGLNLERVGAYIDSLSGRVCGECRRVEA